MDLDEITPELLVGSCPVDADDVARLRNEYGVTGVLCVQTDDDLFALEIDWPEMVEAYRQAGIALRRMPVRDFDEHDLRKNLPKCVEALAELTGPDRVVYVHCNMGMGRSPSVVIAYLHWKAGWDLEDAFEHVTECRYCVPDIDLIRLAGQGSRE